MIKTEGRNSQLTIADDVQVNRVTHNHGYRENNIFSIV